MKCSNFLKETDMVKLIKYSKEYQQRKNDDNWKFIPYNL